MWYLYYAIGTGYICYNACALPQSPISGFSALMKSFYPLCDNYWYKIQRNTAIKLDTDALQDGVGAVKRPANFASLQKKTELNTCRLIHTILD